MVESLLPEVEVSPVFVGVHVCALMNAVLNYFVDGFLPCFRNDLSANLGLPVATIQHSENCRFASAASATMNALVLVHIPRNRCSPSDLTIEFDQNDPMEWLGHLQCADAPRRTTDDQWIEFWDELLLEQVD